MFQSSPQLTPGSDFTEMHARDASRVVSILSPAYARERHDLPARRAASHRFQSSPQLTPGSDSSNVLLPLPVMPFQSSPQLTPGSDAGRGAGMPYLPCGFNPLPSLRQGATSEVPEA